MNFSLRKKSLQRLVVSTMLGSALWAAHSSAPQAAFALSSGIDGCDMLDNDCYCRTMNTDPSNPICCDASQGECGGDDCSAVSFQRNQALKWGNLKLVASLTKQMSDVCDPNEDDSGDGEPGCVGGIRVQNTPFQGCLLRDGVRGETAHRYYVEHLVQLAGGPSYIGLADAKIRSFNCSGGTSESYEFITDTHGIGNQNSPYDCIAWDEDDTTISCVVSVSKPGYITQTARMTYKRGYLNELGATLCRKE